MLRCMRCMQEYEEQLSECPFCGFDKHQREILKESYPEALMPENILMGRYILGCILKDDGFMNTYVAWDALLEKEVVLDEYFPSGLISRTSGEVVVHKEEQTQINYYEYGLRTFEEESEKLNRSQGIEEIVPVFRSFREQKTVYRVSEYQFNDTLEELLANEKKLPARDVDVIFTRLCRAVSHIHENGILHLNLSPDNIYLDDEFKVKMTGFGCAKALIMRHAGMDPEDLPEYMAPELVREEEPGPQADIYSLGIIGEQLYEKAEDLTFFRRSGIRKMLSKATSSNLRKRPKQVQVLIDQIQP